MIIKIGDKSCIIDEDSIELLNNYKWYISGWGYVCTSIKGKTTYLHKLLCNGTIVDHINGNQLDNRKENLRASNKTNNAQNAKKRKNNTSK